ncbi:MAG: tetratricopeptide repeat protein [Syntrophomonadaceae bacterium]|nr:tetratricopeptide repeat protein [Syntrophomonadaceae bacterium]MDD3022453.1 tetratricopeptide repeat protein [Syntrophomonadaceae bacterium]
MKDINDISICSMIDSAIENIRLHDVTMAYESLWEAKKHEPDNVEIINLLAACHYIWGDFEKAEAAWERALELDASNSEANDRLSAFRSPSFQFWLKKYYEAVNQVENRHYEDGQYLLWQLLKENDTFVGVYQLLGLSYLATSDKNTARKVWLRGIELDRSNQLLLNYLDLVIPNPTPVLVTEEAGKAESVWKGIRSRKWLAWGVAGILCLALILQSGLYILAKQSKEVMINDMQTEIALLNQKIAQKSSDVPVFTQYNKASFLENSVSNDGESAAGGSDIDSSQESYYYIEGYRAYLDGDSKKARSNLGMVVEMNTHSYRNREALYYLALIHYLSADYESAENKFIKYLNDYPESNYFDESLFYLGCLYQSKGENDKALEIFKKLQEMVPQSGYLTARVVQDVIKTNK